jgi:predicted ATPase
MSSKKHSVVFTGPQGSGKTTLAQAWSQHYDVPYAGIETRKFLPPGIKSHLDVLSLAVNEPDSGISFQENLIRKRAELFKDLRDTKKVYTSDRAVIDSFVYYAMHNSMFSSAEKSKELEEITREALCYPDITIMLYPSSIQIADDGVRIHSSPYYSAFGATMNYVMNAMLREKTSPDLPPVQITISDKLTVQVAVTTEGSLVAFFLENNGFSSMEDRIAGVEWLTHFKSNPKATYGNHYPVNVQTVH